MPIERSEYDASKPIGGLVASAIDDLKRGRDKLNRAYAAMDVATGTGTDTTVLVGGNFGAADTAAAADMWDNVLGVKTLLDADDAGGLTLYLASLDQGASG